MSAILKRIWSFGKLSFYAHHDQCDVIRPLTRYDSAQVRKCWTASLGLFILTILYGIFGLECESRPLCTIDWAQLPSSPFNLFHQMTPKAVWREANLGALSMWILCIGSWICFLVNRPIERRYLVLLNPGTNDDEFEQMCTFRGPFLKFILAMEMAIYLCGILFVNANVLFINRNYNVTLTSALFWGLFNPFHVFYCVLFIYTIPLYVILTSRYVVIQQKALTRKLIELVGKMNSHIGRGRNLATRRAHHQHLYRQYLCVNVQICDLCKHAREYARFWAPNLTLLFITFIALQCYLFCMFLYVTELAGWLRFILLLAALGVVCIEFVLISQCAAVVKQFQFITRQNRTFCLFYTNTKGVGKILSRNLLKAENLQNNRMLYSYAFRLFGNYRITTKSFHIIISYISIFFLYIIKNKY